MRVIVQNLAVGYTDEGEGPVLLMLHGWQDTSQTFDALATQIPGFRVIRPDLPGFGGTDIPQSAWSVRDYAEFVAAFVEKLKLDVVVVAGHSLGGRIIIKAISLGLLRPQCAVLIASAGIGKSRSARNRLITLAAKTGKTVMAVPPLNLVRDKARRRLYKSIGSDYLESGPLKQTFLNIINEDLQADAARIKLPVLMIWGESDRDTPVADAKLLNRLIADSQLHVLGGADHFVHQQKAAETANLIKEFIT